MLIIGADSTIGSALFAKLKAEGLNVDTTTRETLDLAAPEKFPPLPKADVAFLCAAISTLDACEKNPEAARKVNVEGTLALAKKLHEAGSFVIFLSSNHVFDGTKPHRAATDSVCPINEYGRQKAQTEEGILALKNAAVLRLTKVITRGDPRIAAWAESLRTGKSITAFDDIFLSAVTLDNVLDAMRAIGSCKARGIHQISGQDDFSYFDLAISLARHLSADPALVQRGKAVNVPENFRPRYSSYTPNDLDIRIPGIESIIAYALS